jgi:lysophosphatidate acyltransferase
MSAAIATNELPWLVAKCVVYALVGYIVLATAATAAIAAYQEAKIWRPKSLPSLSMWGHVKVFVFNVVWMMTCLLGSIFITIKWVVSLGTSNLSKDGNRLVEDLAARLVLCCFVGTVQVVGREHLPPPSSDDSAMASTASASASASDSQARLTIPAPVYVANHASQLDAAVVYYLNRRFKWIAKKSILYLPGVGQVMFLSQHVFIDRKKASSKHAQSVSNLFEKSNAAVQAGLPMFFFPQGTRAIAERLPAKDGAFIVAMDNGSPLIPVSVEVPFNAWNSFYPLNQLWGGEAPVVKVTVHASIPVSAKDDRESLKQRCMDQIYSVLPKLNETSKTK